MMKLSEMTEGRRVRIATVVDIYPTGVFEAGLTGTVSEVHEPDSEGAVLVLVKLSEHRQELDEWDNELQVSDEEWSACTPAHFEPA